MKGLNKGIIVLGGHVQSLGITRIMGRLGYTIIVIDTTTKNLARHSKYCSEFYEINNDKLLDKLNEFIDEKKYQNYVLLPTNDYHVELLSNNKKQLQPYFVVGADDWESVSIFYNKISTYQLANKVGIPIAKTIYPTSETELNCIDIEFPCIIKPAVMHAFHAQTKKKVFVCEDEESLIQNYKLAQKYIPKEEIIIQEIIQGPSKNQFSAAFLFLNGKAYVHLVACRMRQHPLDFGNATTYAETVDLPLLKEYGEKLLSAANYNGICEVEFKLDDRDQQFKFLEVNTRSWKWHSIANKAKTPFLPNYINYLYGEEIEVVNGYAKASFYHLITDYPMRLKLLLKRQSYWNRQFHNIESAVYDKDDIKPWIMEKIYLPSLIKNR